MKRPSIGAVTKMSIASSDLPQQVGEHRVQSQMLERAAQMLEQAAELQAEQLQEQAAELSKNHERILARTASQGVALTPEWHGDML